MWDFKENAFKEILVQPYMYHVKPWPHLKFYPSTIHEVAEEKHKTLLSEYLSLGQDSNPKPPNTTY